MRKSTTVKKADNAEDRVDRRSSAASVRLCAGIFLLYQRATGCRESDPFTRDEKSWAAFEQAALPEMASFSFFDRARKTPRTPNSVLADAMGQIWTTEKLSNAAGWPTTIQIVTELANRIASAYELTPIERRTRKRASLGVDVMA